MADPTPLTKRIEPIFGPYAGQQIDLPTADADAAIADGWARDPYAPPSEPDPDAPPVDHTKAIAAAEKAARKLRGEPEPDEAGKASRKPAESKPRGMPKATEEEDEAETGSAEDRSMEAESGAGYQTRESSTEPKPRGRPPRR